MCAQIIGALLIGVTTPETRPAEEVVQHYNPATGPRPLVSSAIWHDIGPVVVKGVEPLLDLPGQQVRPYLNAMTRLVSWSHSHGYALSARTVLATRMVRAYVSTLKPGDAVAFRVYRPLGVALRNSKAQYQSLVLAGTLPNE